MEENIFPDPAVAGILKPNFVESRLHAERMDAAEIALRDRVVGSVAVPVYVVIDPRTDTVLGKHELGGAPGQWKQGMIDFLQESLRKSGAR